MTGDIDELEHGPSGRARRSSVLPARYVHGASLPEGPEGSDSKKHSGPRFKRRVRRRLEDLHSMQPSQQTPAFLDSWARNPLAGAGARETPRAYGDMGFVGSTCVFWRPDPLKASKALQGPAIKRMPRKEKIPDKRTPVVVFQPVTPRPMEATASLEPSKQSSAEPKTPSVSEMPVRSPPSIVPAKPVWDGKSQGEALWGRVPKQRRSGCVVHQIPVSENFHIMDIIKPDFKLGKPYKHSCSPKAEAWQAFDLECDDASDEASGPEESNGGYEDKFACRPNLDEAIVKATSLDAPGAPSLGTPPSPRMGAAGGKQSIASRLVKARSLDTAWDSGLDSGSSFGRAHSGSPATGGKNIEGFKPQDTSTSGIPCAQLLEAQAMQHTRDPKFIVDQKLRFATPQWIASRGLSRNCE